MEPGDILWKRERDGCRDFLHIGIYDGHGAHCIIASIEGGNARVFSVSLIGCHPVESFDHHISTAPTPDPAPEPQPETESAEVVL